MFVSKDEYVKETGEEKERECVVEEVGCAKGNRVGEGGRGRSGERIICL